METHGRQRGLTKGLTFLGPRNLLAWLESPAGAEIRQTIESRWLPSLEAKLFDGSEESKALQAAVLERAGKEVRCVVVIEPFEPTKVIVRVHGPKQVKVKIISLPMAALPTAEQQRALEQMVEVELPWTFRQDYYASSKVSAEVVEILSPEQYLAKEREREWTRLVLNSLAAVKK